jgi:predicted PurR-regulated permease PerM
MSGAGPKPLRDAPDAGAPAVAEARAPGRPRPMSVPPAPARRVGARALGIIALCAGVALLRLGREALIPLGLALLVAFILSGAVEALYRRHVPRALSAIVLLVLIAAAIGGTLDMVAAPAQEWMQNAPRVLRTIEHKVRPVQIVLRRMDYLAQRATAIGGSGDQPAAAPAAPAPAPVLTPAEIFVATGAAALNIVTVLAFAFLLLTAGPGVMARMTCAVAADWPAIRARRVIEAIRHEVGRYYGTLLLINFCFGTVLATTMWLLGMPNAPLWGVLGGILNFVPYVGPAIGVAIVTVVALVTFPGTAHVLLVAASYVALATVEGHIVEPLFIGRRLDLNPVVVLFALWIGGWLWGIPGVVLAMPVLLAIKVIERMAGTRGAPRSVAHRPGGACAPRRPDAPPA